MSDGYWNKFVCTFFQYAPSIVVCLSFLTAGLVFGYSISSFVVERNVETGLIVYGPMILGACSGFVVAMCMYVVKYQHSRIIYWQFNILLAAGVIHLLASCFYFANDLDDVGAFISYFAHSMTFIAGLSYLHSIPGRYTRAILISTTYSIYLLGIAIAVSLIDTAYSHNVQSNPQGNADGWLMGIYVSFAGVYLTISILMLVILIGLRVLAYLGTVDTENSMDNEFRIANSNGSIFENRQAIIKRIQFFYVTRSQQWNVTALLVYVAAIQFALIIYYIFWMSLNPAMRLTDVGRTYTLFWMIFLGSVVSTAILNFVSVKITFVANQLCLCFLALLSMLVATSVQPTVMFWIILFFFGLSFANLQIVLLEVTHFLFTEIIIYVSYFLNLLSTCIIYFYFVSNGKNSYFYSEDYSTLMAQGFVFLIITSLLALIVGMKVPRTYRTSLFDIQYGLMGIIFMKHQIEQLNVKWLNDGTIPTISRPDEY